MLPLTAIALSVILYCGVTFVLYLNYMKGNAHVRATYRRHHRDQGD